MDNVTIEYYIGVKPSTPCGELRFIGVLDSYLVRNTCNAARFSRLDEAEQIRITWQDRWPEIELCVVKDTLTHLIEIME